jgi:hypothetical protein
MIGAGEKEWSPMHAGDHKVEAIEHIVGVV